MRSYGGLFEPRGSNLTQLKSTFNAEDLANMQQPYHIDGKKETFMAYNHRFSAVAEKY